MSVVIVYGSGMFCDNQCQDDNGAGTGITCTYTKGKNDNTLNTVLYQKVSGRYKQVAKSSRYLIYRFSYGKKLYFSSADDEGTGITCTYTKGKNGFKLERSKMVLTERSGRYAVGYICMIVYTIL